MWNDTISGNLQQLRLFRIRTWFPFHWECAKIFRPNVGTCLWHVFLTYHRARNMPKACRYAMALSFLVIWHKPNTKLVIQSYLFFSTPPISPTIFPHNKHTKLPFNPKSPTTPHHHTHKSVTEASKRRDMPSACFKRNRQNAKALPRTVKALYQYHFCNFTPHYPTSKKNRLKSDFNGWNRCHLPPPTTHKKFNLWKFVLIRG